MMKRFLVRIRQLCTKIVHVLSKHKLLLMAVSMILMSLFWISIFLMVSSLFFNFALFFVAIPILLFVWVGCALIAIVENGEDFYF